MRLRTPAREVLDHQMPHGFALGLLNRWIFGVTLPQLAQEDPLHLGWLVGRGRVDDVRGILHERFPALVLQ